jgi:two-component sensor histidine kinase
VNHGSGGTSLNVEYEIEIEDMRIDIERAIPYGLILNELLSNEYKHAFTEGEGGFVRVELSDREGAYQLTLCDDGIGLPPDFDEIRRSSMGLQIVDSLVSQLDGHITYLSKNFPGSPTDCSTEIRLVFPHA